jgi:hypothetical protein
MNNLRVALEGLIGNSLDGIAGIVIDMDFGDILTLRYKVNSIAQLYIGHHGNIYHKMQQFNAPK